MVVWVAGALIVGGIAGFYLGGARADSSAGVSEDGTVVKTAL